MSARTNQYHPDTVSHPGETLREKLEELNLGTKEFAIRTGKPEKTISLVLNGKSSITPDMAILFESVLGIPAHFWMQRQNLYNESQSRQKRLDEIRQEDSLKDWARSFPYAAMVKNGWVPKVQKAEEKVIALFEYFAVASNEAWESFYIYAKLKVAFRISLAHTKCPHSLSAWLRHGELEASRMTVADYSKVKLEAALPEIKKVMASHPPDFFKQLQSICAAAGVKVLYTPSLPRAPISGSTRWLGDTPLIQLTGRYKTNDSFWFTFFHEVGHILKHGKKYISLEKVDYDEKDEMKEKEADEFAIYWTLSAEEEDEVLKYPMLTNDLVIELAQQFGTHPAIIIGRLHHKKLLPYSFGRDFIQPIDLG